MPVIASPGLTVILVQPLASNRLMAGPPTNHFSIPPSLVRPSRVIIGDRRKWLSRPRQHQPRKPQIENEENCPDHSAEPHRNPKIDRVCRALDLAAAFERHEPLSHAKV